MTTFQIIALIFIGLGVLVALGFFIAFLVELNKSEKDEEENVVEEVEEVEVNNEINEIDIDDMLAKLEENSKSKEEVVEETNEEVDIDEMLAKLEESVVEETVENQEKSQ